MADTHLIHCAYHKCLTVYFKRVMHAVLNLCRPWTRLTGSGGYRHYNSHLDDFYEGFRKQRVASVNNRAVDLERLGRFRISRFIRDPRDLVVSGYFYHRRGAEEWTRIERPTVEDWYFANGCIPNGVRSHNLSFAEYLQSVSEEDGLLAELEFRRHHFESMAEWPADHPDIKLYRYEDVVGDEERVFREIFAFYGLSSFEKLLGNFFARRYSYRKIARDPHVRNPASGQWKKHFTPRVKEAFDTEYGDLVARLGYPPE